MIGHPDPIVGTLERFFEQRETHSLQPAADRRPVRNLRRDAQPVPKDSPLPRALPIRPFSTTPSAALGAKNQPPIGKATCNPAPECKKIRPLFFAVKTLLLAVKTLFFAVKTPPYPEYRGEGTRMKP